MIRVAFLSCALALPGSLIGASIGIGVGVNVSYYAFEDGFVPSVQQSQGGLTSAYISTCVVSTALREVCGEAYATPGTIGTRSSLRNSDPTTIPVGGGESGNGGGVFTDILTITGLVSGNYTLVPTVSVSGASTWNQAPFHGTVGIGFFQFGPSGDINDVLSNQNFDATQPTYSNVFTLAGVPFQPGVPFYFNISFGNAARIYSGPAGVQNTFVSANFLSTMRLTGLEVRDQNGMVVPFSSLSVQSQLGTEYTQSGVVPEPSSVALVLGGILLVALRQARQPQR